MVPPSKHSWQVVQACNNALDVHTAGFCSVKVLTLNLEESFARRIELSNIAMDPDGSFSAYFDDDDMFFGHCVVVYGTLEGGGSSAVMAG